MRVGTRRTEGKAVALWSGDETPCGTLSTGSAAFQIHFDQNSDPTRHIADPTELLAAAHAACFSIFLAAELNQAGLPARTIRTTSVITLNHSRKGSLIRGATLEVVAAVPGAAPGDFIGAAVNAKLICPVCRLLNVDITMNAKLDY